MKEKKEIEENGINENERYVLREGESTEKEMEAEKELVIAEKSELEKVLEIILGAGEEQDILTNERYKGSSTQEKKTESELIRKAKEFRREFMKKK